MQRWSVRKIILLLIPAVVIAASFLVHATTIPSRSDLLSVVPGSKSFDHNIRPVDYYIMKGGNGDRVGVSFITSAVPPDVSGYGGEIDVLVGMDMSGRITGVRILGHSESPDFMGRVIGAGLLQRFVGREHGDAFSDIEAVTGATLTSQAIIDDIKTAIPAVAGEILKDARKMPTGGGILDVQNLRLAGVLAIIIAAIIAISLPRIKILRVIVLVSAVGVIGVWENIPITIGALVDFRNLQISFSAGLPILILIIFAFIAALVKGNMYCSYLCPFGALQTGAAKVGLPKICPSKAAVGNMEYLRWIVAIVSIYEIAATGSIAFRSIEPFALCFSHEPDRPALIQAAVVMAAALFVGRVWCRFFCPTGLILDLFAMLGAKIRHGIRHHGGEKQ